MFRRSQAHLLALSLAAIVACDRAETRPPAADGIEAPAPPAGKEFAAPADAQAPRPDEKVAIPEVAIRATLPSKIHVAWQAPKGTGVNEGAPFRVRWISSDGLAEAPADVKAKGGDVPEGFDVVVRPSLGVPAARLAGDVDLVICDVATHRVCVPLHRRIEMSFKVSAKADAAELRVAVPLPEAKP